MNFIAKDAMQFPYDSHLKDSFPKTQIAVETWPAALMRDGAAL
jgi:hypothetical protein